MDKIEEQLWKYKMKCRTVKNFGLDVDMMFNMCYIIERQKITLIFWF